MRQFILVILIFLISCSQKHQTKDDKILNQSDKRNYATELIENGFLKYADSLKINHLKMEIINSFNFYNDDNYKIAHIDAEALAEFNFDFFLPTLNKILAKRDINLSVKKLNNNDDSFDVLINGKTIQLYTKSELDNYTYWETAPSNFFKHVNKILKSKKSEEQFYLLYKGNDLLSILLTEKQFLIISDYYKNNKNEIPYEP